MFYLQTQYTIRLFLYSWFRVQKVRSLFGLVIRQCKVIKSWSSCFLCFNYCELYWNCVTFTSTSLHTDGWYFVVLVNSNTPQKQKLNKLDSVYTYEYFICIEIILDSLDLVLLCWKHCSTCEDICFCFISLICQPVYLHSEIKKTSFKHGQKTRKQHLDAAFHNEIVP